MSCLLPGVIGDSCPHIPTYTHTLEGTLLWFAGHVATCHYINAKMPHKVKVK